MKPAGKSRRRKADASRQLIVEAARAHFFSHGFRSVTMDDLADELGVSKKTLYALFPSKINVAVATALATAGADKTGVTVCSVPGFKGDDHRIEVVGDEVRVVVDIYSKTSAIAGWSVVALLRNLVSPIVF